MGVGSDGRQTDADVLAVLLQHLAQVHGQRLEDEAEVLGSILRISLGPKFTENISKG
jgi:hypothetical protein